MGHDHSHSHDNSSYYMEQLCTIGICAALGGVAIMMTVQDKLKIILAPQFHLPVLLGGVALLILAVVRGFALWAAAGKPAAAGVHTHDDDEVCCDDSHSHDHDHAHEHHDHSHHDHGDSPGHDHHHEHAHAGHGHSHAWGPWRYAILLLPVVLYFLNLPNEGFSADYTLRQFGREKIDTDVQTVDDKGGDVVNLGFKELEVWAFSEQARKTYEGQTGRLKGQFVSGLSSQSFRLVRFKMTCCAADAIPLRVVIVSKEPIADIPALQWVEVEGQIQFRKREDREEYLPVLQVKSRDKVQPVAPENNPYLQ